MLAGGNAEGTGSRAGRDVDPRYVMVIRRRFGLAIPSSIKGKSLGAGFGKPATNYFNRGSRADAFDLAANWRFAGKCALYEQLRGTSELERIAAAKRFKARCCDRFDRRLWMEMAARYLSARESVRDLYEFLRYGRSSGDCVGRRERQGTAAALYGAVRRIMRAWPAKIAPAKC